MACVVCAGNSTAARPQPYRPRGCMPGSNEPVGCRPGLRGRAGSRSPAAGRISIGGGNVGASSRGGSAVDAAVPSMAAGGVRSAGSGICCNAQSGPAAEAGRGLPGAGLFAQPRIFSGAGLSRAFADASSRARIAASSSLRAARSASSRRMRSASSRARAPPAARFLELLGLLIDRAQREPARSDRDIEIALRRGERPAQRTAISGCRHSHRSRSKRSA